MADIIQATRNQLLAFSAIPKNTREATFNRTAFLGAVSEVGVATMTSFDIAATTLDAQIVFSGFLVVTNSGAYSVQVFGDTTDYSGGAAITAYPTNFNNTEAPKIQDLVLNPTVVTLGNAKIPELKTFGNNSRSQYNQVLQDVPLILEPNSKYIFRVTHTESQSRDFDVIFSAFENIVGGAPIGQTKVA